MTILLTGAAGFVGRYMAPRLRAAFPGETLVEVVRTGPVAEGGRAVDLADAEATDALMRDVRPEVVVHLAAHSSVGLAASMPSRVWRDNRDATVHLARAIGRHAPGATVLMSSTAEVYGRNLKAGPATEETPPAPRGPYAVSKRAAEFGLAALLPPTAQWIIARPFNHTGVGQTETFVVASFAAQIARAEAGLAPPRLRVGNLDAERDFLDVRDVADGYAALLRARHDLPPALVVNVVRGVPVSIRSILDMLLSMARVPIGIDVDPARLRPNEIPSATATVDRLASLIPWPPARPLVETLEKVLEDQRARVAGSPS